jgi:hypothetical protein
MPSIMGCLARMAAVHLWDRSVMSASMVSVVFAGCWSGVSRILSEHAYRRISIRRRNTLN